MIFDGHSTGRGDIMTAAGGLHMGDYGVKPVDGGTDDFWNRNMRAQTLAPRFHGGDSQVTTQEMASNEANAAPPGIDKPPGGIPRWALYAAAAVALYLVVK